VMQKARIEAARKNTFYSIEQATLSAGVVAYYVDLGKNNTLAAGTADLMSCDGRKRRTLRRGAVSLNSRGDSS